MFAIISKSNVPEFYLKPHLAPSTGMMPLWLYMATEYVIDLGDHVKVPYTVIARTLAMFVLPCFLGLSSSIS